MSKKKKSKYSKCIEEGHEFTTYDEEFTFEEYEATLICSKCGATVEVSGDIRTDDGRYIGWEKEQDEEE